LSAAFMQQCHLPYICGYFFFFFQAEDGIRDYKVTGVQTCALPIFRQIVRAQTGGERVRVRLTNELGVAPVNIGAVHIARSSLNRSEERRVGKECRSRWSGDQ